MSANETRHEVDVTAEDGSVLGRVSVVLLRPARSKATVVTAHGAGGTMDTPSIVSLGQDLASRGVTFARFNFLYSERGKRAPDKQPTLVATWRSVADWVRSETRPKRLFLGGRSMGGRMASYLVADGYPCEGLFFLAYPLHPPGKPEKLRKDHLPSIEVPILFVSGTRDTFAQLPLLQPVVDELEATLHLIEGADHGFRVPKKLGRSAEAVSAEVTTTLMDFISHS